MKKTDNKLKRVASLIGDPFLQFEFPSSLEGINYYLVDKNRTTKYLSSSYLARDRKKLSQSAIWQEHKEKFLNGKFLVSSGDLHFVSSSNIWAPSVDSFFLLHEFKRRNILKNTSSILDMGAGTGVMGLGCIKINPSINFIAFVEKKVEAFKLIAQNILINEVEKKNFNILNSVSGKNIDFINIDLGVVTPFYIPVKKEFSKKLLNKTLKEAVKMISLTSKITQKTYFVYSSSTVNELKKVANFNWKNISSLEVPFPVELVKGNHSNIKKNERFIKKEDSQFPYWHKIILAKVLNVKKSK
ncbi:MAG: methyltransferase [Elusimicrobiota bacterium]